MNLSCSHQPSTHRVEPPDILPPELQASLNTKATKTRAEMDAPLGRRLETTRLGSNHPRYVGEKRSYIIYIYCEYVYYIYDYMDIK